MFDMALVTGIIIMLAAVTLAVLIGVLVFARRRAATGKAGNKAVPPPADPVTPHPEQAKDVNAERDEAKRAARDATKDADE